MPLEGVTVIDLGTLFAAPWIATYMGDFGAEVIKIEHPLGDSLRDFASQKNGVSLWWKLTGRNKKSVTCNLSTPEGQKIVKKLCEKAVWPPLTVSDGTAWPKNTCVCTKEFYS